MVKKKKEIVEEKVEEVKKVKVEEPVVFEGYFVEDIRAYGPSHPHYFMVEKYDAQK